MSELVRHAFPRAYLGPQLIYRTARDRDDKRVAPEVVTSHVTAVRSEDSRGTLHEPAPWRCPCGATLALEYAGVPGAWVAHAAEETELPPAVLAVHMLEDVRGQRAEAFCICGFSFQAPADDPLNGDAAVAAWAAHVNRMALGQAAG